MDTTREHNYEIEKTNEGFMLYSKRNDVKAEYIMNEYGFWEEHHLDSGNTSSIFDFSADFPGFSAKYYDEIPAFAFRRIIKSISSIIYNGWKCKEGTKFQAEIKIKEWAESHTSRVINYLVYPIWKEKVSEIDPTVVELHKSLFSVSGGGGHFARIKNVIDSKNKHVINDILKYRAARIHMLYKRDYREYIPTESWMLDYSRERELYGSLRKTLSNLPANIVPGMLFNLENIRLPEPATSRIRLLSYLSLAQRYEPTNLDVITRSTDEQIKQAIKYIWNLYPGKKKSSFLSASEICRAIGLIFDMPGEYGKIDIIGAARRSHEYHRDIERQTRLQQEEYMRKNAHKMEQNTATPPIPLPKNDEIKFLSTYRDVVEEGNKMGHCIATYAAGAVGGHCYLFHVDYKGEAASVEVGPDGIVKQSYGPRDSHNKASEYGRNVLSKWAKGLQSAVSIQM